MLKDMYMRKVLISAMKENEAEEFAKLIGITKWNDVHYALLNKKFRKNELGKALMFFGKKIEDVESYDYSKEDKEDVSPEKPLFPHQINTVHKIRKKLSMEPYKVLLHMPTGSGKTLCATRVVLMHLLRNPNDLVVWLAHNEELCEQAISEFKRTWSVAGDRKINTYRFFKRSKLNPSYNQKRIYVLQPVKNARFCKKKQHIPFGNGQKYQPRSYRRGPPGNGTKIFHHY